MTRYHVEVLEHVNHRVTVEAATPDEAYTVAEERVRSGSLSFNRETVLVEATGGISVADDRQPRERSVPCVWCRRSTFDVDAVCADCRALGRSA